jgi:hypothetical protein
MQQQFGQAAFGFHPDTFQLPAEHQQLVERWAVGTYTVDQSTVTCHQLVNPRMERENYSKVYIVKLPNNMCGIGACVIDHPGKVMMM